jgi:hypothetical protein
MKKPKKEPKERANTYEKPLKIHGTFKQAIKELVREPKSEYKKENKNIN